MGLVSMALPFDYLDSMAWSIVVSAVLLAVAAIRLSYKVASDSIEEEGRKLRIGFAAGIGASGFYLFITGLSISFMWPYAFSGGVYNILFGGVATLGGLVLLATAAAFFFNSGFQAVSYFALVVGIYAAVDAFAMLNYGLTKEPSLSALAYLSFTAPAVLSVPATHIENKWARWLFALFAFLFAIAWLYQAYEFTSGHLEPPQPA